MHDQQAILIKGEKMPEDKLTMGVDTYNNSQSVETTMPVTSAASDPHHIPCTYSKEQELTTVVRRLTPNECERLQGFPDNWTMIGDWVDSKGRIHKEADTPRYKALGNSIALPFWFWLMRRISAQYERPATLGSLFDGIGGFPLCWIRCNGTGSVLWSSEIEEFPIAVLKKHFGDENTEGDVREYL